MEGREGPSKVQPEIMWFCPLPKMTRHLGLPQPLGYFLLQGAEIGRRTATWHLWTIAIATTGQSFYSGHGLGVVLPHVLFFNGMGSLPCQAAFPCPFLHIQPAKQRALATASLQCLARLVLFMYLKLRLSVQAYNRLKMQPARSEGQWRCPAMSG